MIFSLIFLPEITAIIKELFKKKEKQPILLTLSVDLGYLRTKLLSSFSNCNANLKLYFQK